METRCLDDQMEVLKHITRYTITVTMTKIIEQQFYKY